MEKEALPSNYRMAEKVIHTRSHCASLLVNGTFRAIFWLVGSRNENVSKNESLPYKMRACLREDRRLKIAMPPAIITTEVSVTHVSQVTIVPTKSINICAQRVSKLRTGDQLPAQSVPLGTIRRLPDRSDAIYVQKVTFVHGGIRHRWSANQAKFQAKDSRRAANVRLVTIRQ